MGMIDLDFLQLFVIKDGANFMGHVIKSSASTTQFRKMGIIFQEVPSRIFLVIFTLAPLALFALVVFPLLTFAELYKSWNYI